MASSAGSLSPAPNENEVLNCKYCLKKVVTKVKCIKCAGVFHPACFKQSSESRNAECKHETKSSMTPSSSVEQTYLNEENKLLRQMIADKNVIIADKEKLIQMFQEKIQILETKQLNTPPNNSPYPGKNEIDKEIRSRSKKSHTPKNSQQASTTISNIKNPTAGNSKLQGEPTVTVNQVAAEILKIKTQQTVNEIINLTTRDHDNHNQHQTEMGDEHDEERTERGFTQVNRRLKKRTHKVGTGEGDENLKGKEADSRKIWLFVSKVPDNVELENIKKYIQNKTHLDDIYVKKLTTRQNRTDHQSFMIGVNPEVQEQVYEPNFWPRNIYFNRFNFRKGQHFLDHSPESQGQVNFQRPASFQNSTNL